MVVLSSTSAHLTILPTEGLGVPQRWTSMATHSAIRRETVSTVHQVSTIQHPFAPVLQPLPLVPVLVQLLALLCQQLKPANQFGETGIAID